MTQQTEGRAAGPVLLRLGRMFLEGIGTEEDAGSAQVCFRKAESFLENKNEKAIDKLAPDNYNCTIG